MTRPGIEPRSPGPLANTLTARPMSGTCTITINKHVNQCKNSSVTLSEHAITAFKKVMEMLPDTTKLSHIQPNRELYLAVDTSAIGIGAILQQKYESEWKQISFFSKTLTEAETRYSTFGRELLATFAAKRHYRQLLEGQQFYILTDHKPLLGALKSSSEKYSPHEIRQMDYILQFTSDIKYIKGVDKVPAGALSRGINSFQLEPSINIHTFSKG